MFQDYYRDRAPDYLGKEFGPRFAQAVAKLAPGSWQGPIESGFGWHLVFVDTVIPGCVPNFEEIEPDVKTAWLGEQMCWHGRRRIRRCAPSTRYCCGRLARHKRQPASRPRHGKRIFPRRRVKDRSENSKREARNPNQIPMMEILENSTRRPGGIGFERFLLSRISNLSRTSGFAFRASGFVFVVYNRDRLE